MNNMKLSDNTLTILKNFAGINNSILVKEGNKLRTISVAKNILAEADITEEFPRDFAIYDYIWKRGRSEFVFKFIDPRNSIRLLRE